MSEPVGAATQATLVAVALSMVEEFKGDERCGLNCLYSEALAREVIALSAELERLKTGDAQVAALRETAADLNRKAWRSADELIRRLSDDVSRQREARDRRAGDRAHA